MLTLAPLIQATLSIPKSNEHNLHDAARLSQLCLHVTDRVPSIGPPYRHPSWIVMAAVHASGAPPVRFSRLVVMLLVSVGCVAMRWIAFPTPALSCAHHEAARSRLAVCFVRLPIPAADHPQFVSVEALAIAAIVTCFLHVDAFVRVSSVAVGHGTQKNERHQHQKNSGSPHVAVESRSN